MNPSVKHLYHQGRRLGYRAADALRDARIIDRAEEAEAAGLLRWTVEPYDTPDLSFVEDWPEREAQYVIDLAERDGVWVVSAQVRCDRGHWYSASSIGGLIGDPGSEEGFPRAYRAELASEALAELGTRTRDSEAEGWVAPRPALSRP